MLRSRGLLLLVVSLSVTQVRAQTAPPKLVVGIVVDQMRQEYLYRFGNKFGEGGFKRLMNDGFMMKNAHYNYVPTIQGQAMLPSIPVRPRQFMALSATTGTISKPKKWSIVSKTQTTNRSGVKRATVM